MSKYIIKTIRRSTKSSRFDRVAIITLFTEQVKWEGSRVQAEKMLKWLNK
jgi:hypothetical protein